MFGLQLYLFFGSHTSGQSLGQRHAVPPKNNFYCFTRQPADLHARINARAAALPGLHLVGNAYDGIGIPDCIRLGRQAAQELLASRSEVNDAASSSVSELAS